MLAIALLVSTFVLLFAGVGWCWRRRRGGAPTRRPVAAPARDGGEHLPECGNAGDTRALAAFYAYQLGSARARAPE